MNVEKIVEGGHLDGNQAAFIRDRMIADKGEWEGRYDRAKGELRSDVPSYMDQIDIVTSLANRTGEKKSLQPKKGDGVLA